MQALDLTLRQRAMAIGTLELLWHFTAEFAPQGDIGKYTDARIESGVDWSGRKGTLVPALITSGWCDACDLHRVVVHDWHDHADEATKKKLVRAGLTFLSVTEKVSRQRQKMSAPEADNSGLPEPMPEPEPLPQPRQPPIPPLNCQSEYPLTIAEIRKRDPATDEIFVLRLVHTTVQHCMSHPKFPQDEIVKITDNVIAKACAESFATGPPNHRAGLLLNRVPPIIVSWALEP